MSDTRRDALKQVGSILISSYSSTMAKKKTTLPKAGSVFVFPLNNGMYASCWVLASKVIGGIPHRLVACTSLFSRELPDALTEPMLKVLYPDHHGIKKKADILWLDVPPPTSFVFIGRSKAPANYSESHCDTFGGWESFHYSAITQWRWENERDALLSEELTEEKRRSEKYQNELIRLEAERRSMSLKQLAKYKFFAEWDDYPSQTVTRSSRRIMTKLAKELIALGENAEHEMQLEAVKRCVQAFNELQRQFEEFSDTDIREDIVDEISLFGYACGFEDLNELVDEWRDW